MNICEGYIMENQVYSTPLYDTPSLFFNAVGEEHCTPGHFCGPKIRQHYLFHFIVSGEGIFRIRDKTYKVTANQGFLIPDSSVIYYQADMNNPWHYFWLNLQGNGAKDFFESLNLSLEQPIYTAKENNDIYSKFQQILHSTKNPQNNSYSVTAALFSCLFSLQKYSETFTKNKVSVQETYVCEAKNLIASYYHHNDLSIDKISRLIGINRSYLSRLFYQYEHVSIQQYLINFRLNIARELLKSTNETISTIAVSVGYNDIYNFSKMYKKTFACSPAFDRE